MKTKWMQILAIVSHLYTSTTNANLELISSYISPGCEGSIVYSMDESSFIDEPNIINVWGHESEILEAAKKVYSKHFGGNFHDANADEIIIYFSAINDCIAYANVKVPLVKGSKGSNVGIFSEHNYCISNNSNRNVDCKLQFGLLTHDFLKSSTYEFSCTLRPKEIKNGTHKLNLVSFYGSPGNYKIHAYTNITGGCSASENCEGTLNIQ